MNESYAVGTRVTLGGDPDWLERAGTIRRLRYEVGGAPLALVCFDGTISKPETLAWVPTTFLLHDDDTHTPIAGLGDGLVQVSSHLGAAAVSVDQALRWFERVGDDHVELNIIRTQLEITCREMNEHADQIDAMRAGKAIASIS